MAKNKPRQASQSKYVAMLNKAREISNTPPDFSSQTLYGVDIAYYKQLLKHSKKAFAFMYKVMSDQNGLNTAGKDRYYKSYYNNISIQFNRFFRYMQYAQMVKMTPEIAAAIDTYTDTCVQRDYLDRYYYFVKNGQVASTKASIDETIDELYRLAAAWNIDAQFLRKLFRFLVKYGDAFILIDYYDDNIRQGIRKLMIVPPYYMQSIFDQDGRLMGYNINRNNLMVYYGSGPYISDLVGSQSAPTITQFDKDIYGSEAHPQLSPLQVLHVKINEEEFSPYGSSILDDIRRIWKQLVMAEDLLLAFLMVRGINRKIITVKLGNKPLEQAMQELQLVRATMRIEPRVTMNGDIDSNALIQTLSDDIFLPNVGGEDKYSISEWGAQNVDGFMKTIEYFRDKITTKLRIPPGMLTMDKDINGKNTLETEIVAFARIIMSIQEEVADQLMTLFRLHYDKLGEPYKLNGIKLAFTQPYLHKFEEARDNALKLRVDIATQLKQLLTDPEQGYLADVEYIIENILYLPKEVLRNAEINYDKQQAKQQPADKDKTLDIDDIKASNETEDEQLGAGVPGSPESPLEFGAPGGELGGGELGGGLAGTELGGSELASPATGAGIEVAPAAETAAPPVATEVVRNKTQAELDFIVDIMNSASGRAQADESIFYNVF